MGNDTIIFGVRMWGGTTPTWKARDNGSEINIIGAPTPLVNTWYHIRIDFEHTTGGYQGLSQNEYYVFVDGNRYGPYRFDIEEQLEELHLHTYSYGAGYNVYFDAVGYSWDPPYEVGDNLYEGLLLSYETNLDLDWWGYSLDSQNFVTILGNTTIPMPEDGQHTIQVFGDNLLGKKYKSAIRNFTIDTKIPEIRIHSPIPDEFYRATPPKYNISIIEANLEFMWYTLDDGITNITFSGLTGIINQIEWDKKGSGMMTIRFYANDTSGKAGYADVSVYKDIDRPEIAINKPSQDAKFGNLPPNFDISILELNLESIWYTLDGGINNYTIDQLTGTINQMAWEAAPYGNITIRFYAKDLVGNIGYNEVVVEKVEEFPIELIILISIFSGAVVIGLASILLIRRKRKRIQ